MANMLVSSWAKNVDTMPENYVMPPDKRPGELVSIGSNIPVIDLAKSSNHAGIVQEILKASQEFGLFQVCKSIYSKSFFSYPNEMLIKTS